MDNELANAIESAERLAERPKFKSTSTDIISLNFKVPLQLRLQFKVYATKQNMTMTELLLQLFEDRLRAEGVRINTLTGNEIKK
jgi:hypothetical protein